MSSDMFHLYELNLEIQKQKAQEIKDLIEKLNKNLIDKSNIKVNNKIETK